MKKQNAIIADVEMENDLSNMVGSRLSFLFNFGQ